MEVWIAEARKTGGKNYPVRRFVGDVGAPTDDGLIPIIMSTSGDDRARDTVSDAGWNLTNYLKNPVLQWSHDPCIPAIGRMEGLATGPLRGSMRFTPRDMNPFGDMIGGLYRGGFLKGGSVGFMPEEWTFNETGGVQFIRQELLEFSCCNVPMNPDALASAKSMGIDVALFLPFAEKTLDGDAAAPFWMDGKQAGVIYRSLTGPRVQVPASAPLNAGPSTAEIMAEVKRLGSIVDGFGKALAAQKAEPAPVPVAAPPAPPPVPKGLTAEKRAALMAEMKAYLNQRVAALTGAVVDEQ